MKNMSKWVLGRSSGTGTDLGARPARRRLSFRVHVSGRGLCPPCPGAGYVWIAGCMNRGYWVPGRWEFRGYRDRDHVAYFHHDRDDRFYRDRDDRRFERNRDWDHDHSVDNSL